MSESTINISKPTHDILIELAESSGETIQTVLDKAIENYRRILFLKEANRAFANLRKNEALWQEELEERQLWEDTIGDGVEEE
jgi:hypothetical protein